VSPPSRVAAVTAWSEAEVRHALSPEDHRVIEATLTIREWIVELAQRQGQGEDLEELYDACAALGRLVAEGGGSASLAALSIDRGCRALGEQAPEWVEPARAALAEGFARALVDGARKAGHASWDFPASAVRVDDTTIAIAAGHPSDDDEILAGWAARAARAAVRGGFRRALVSGPDRPRTALAEALAIAGIECSERVL
jgi:hypothetical protein